MRSKMLGAAMLVMLGCREGGCRITEAEVVDVLAKSYCESRWSADCGGPGVSRHECESHLRRVGDEVRAEAHDLGLEFDEHCAQEHRDRYESEDFEPLEPGEERCAIWVGDGREGESCESASGLTTCASGSSCNVLGVCELDDPGLELGADCFDVDIELKCADGLTCVWGECAPIPEIGERCSSRCVDGAFCDFETEVCVSGLGRDEPCGLPGIPDECSAGLECLENACVDAPHSICREGPPWPW